MTDSTPEEPTVWLSWSGTWEPDLEGVYATLEDAKAADPAITTWVQDRNGRWLSPAKKAWIDDDRAGGPFDRYVVLNEFPLTGARPTLPPWQFRDDDGRVWQLRPPGRGIHLPDDVEVTAEVTD